MQNPSPVVTYHHIKLGQDSKNQQYVPSAEHAEESETGFDHHFSQCTRSRLKLEQLLQSRMKLLLDEDAGSEEPVVTSGDKKNRWDQEPKFKSYIYMHRFVFHSLVLLGCQTTKLILNTIIPQSVLFSWQ
jgi:hypothetical protein